jgi:glycerophosphoryl diester phosphodiesterase
MSPRGVEIIGHRGYAARFPENTLPSLLGALDAGATSLEFDVRVAACGTPVLFHDPSLERTTSGEGLVAEHSLETLRALDAGSWFSPEFAGTPIPTLQEALGATLARTGGPRARRLYVELKAVQGPGDLVRILELLNGSGGRDRIVVISLDFELLAQLRAMDPDLLLGYVVESEERLEEALPKVRADGRSLLDPNQALLRKDPARTSSWIEEGLRLATWTVNEESHARALLAMGVRRLTTDEPGQVLGGLSRTPGGATRKPFTR